MQRAFSETISQEQAADREFTTRNHSSRGRSGDLTWAYVLECRRVLLVAEAGAGKTYECERQAATMFARGEPAFYLRLENVAALGVAGPLLNKQKRRFEAWLASSSQLGYFFLDSVDELQLVHGSFRAALERLAEDLEGALGRAVIVVTSRPVPIDRQAFTDILPVPIRHTKAERGKSFVRIAMRDTSENDDDKPADTFKEFSLLPLSDRQIVELAREHRVQSPEKLQREIDTRHAHDFARWPQELIELCDDWKVFGGIRPHYKQVESHVQARLAARPDRREKADLSPEKARQGAQRLALAVMLCRRWTFRYGAAADLPGSGEEPVDPTPLLADWNPREVAALLERPLFGDGGYGRARFRHRSVLEYLAACEIHHRIESGKLSLSAAKRMVFGITDTNKRVSKPSLKPVAAWLALLRQDVFEAMLHVDPGTLLIHGDPESLQPAQCERALQAFVEHHGKGQWRGLEVPSLQVSRLARQPLGNAIVRLWHGGIENPEIRELLVRMAGSGSFQECSDLAASVASDPNAGNAERFESMVALSRLSDDRLNDLVKSATSMAKGWSETIARWVGTYLYPEHVTDDQLLRLLEKVKRDSRRGTDYAASVARVVEKADLDVGRLKALLQGLIPLTRELVTLDDDEVDEPPGTLKVTLILRAVCARLLGHGVHSDEVLLGSVIALRSAEARNNDRSGNKELMKRVAELSAQDRRRIFDTEYAWIIERYPDREPRDVYVRLVFRDGAVSYTLKQDWNWIIEAIGDATAAVERRTVLLHLAVYLAPLKGGRLAGMKAVRRAIAGSAGLEAQLDDSVAAATRRDPQHTRMEKQRRKREKQRQRETAEQQQQWLEVWRALAKKPAVALAANRRDSTIWNIALALRNKPKNHGETRWDRAFLQRQFGPVATDALRLALMAYWRGLQPTVRRERKAGEKNTYLVVWSNALMGVYAEAEDPCWAQKLSPAEAELAARYALLELNGLPSWLVPLGIARADVVERVIGEEIEEELSEPAGPDGWSSTHLQAVRYGRRETAALLEPRLVAWLKGARALTRAPHTKEAESKLDQVVRTLLTHGSDPIRRYLAELATRELSKAGDGPFLDFWLPVLCRTHARRGLVALLALLHRLPVEPNGTAVRLIGRLFDERSDPSAVNWRAQLSPNDRLLLVKAVFRHVQSANDVEHEGAYSPGSRDHAEDGRRYAFNELMAATGPEAMAAKIALAEDAAFSHLRDRITLLARERLATEIDASVFSPDDLAKMFAGGELTPKTSMDMAHLLVDRLDDLRELMLRDTGPRAAWAMVDDENALRPAIAREFEVAARGAYTVDQEAVTADGKETDIRLRAVAELQATIELKIGEKERSGRELRDTINDQLVKKYMAHSKANTGCLLVTVSNPDKRWQHPETGSYLDRFQLQELLEEAAQEAQQRLGGDARVLARVLDLTSRLPTEATAKRQKVGRKKRASAT